MEYEAENARLKTPCPICGKSGLGCNQFGRLDSANPLFAQLKAEHAKLRKLAERRKITPDSLPRMGDEIMMTSR
jgi:hypothetical protein